MIYDAVRARFTAPGTGFEPSHQAAKQKRKRLQKLAGGFKSPNHPPGWKWGSLNCLQDVTWPGASINTGPGELVAPNVIGAPSPNATIGLGAPNAVLNQICWVLQQISYQEDLLQNSTSRSLKSLVPTANPAANPAVVPAFSNHPSCTEVLVDHLEATGVAVNIANKFCCEKHFS
ncbi:hypothetical protein DSO57_1024973 [Entomophthora muscae]|uniref:Uncharacterized protein n=1 Tax=Entomophthora muscae TaxID=34485 RepID=A0ACC2TP89_9FUNG|nr:hypothetical protein DSO57_1024973 [Entomophthora muscae]